MSEKDFLEKFYKQYCTLTTILKHDVKAKAFPDLVFEGKINSKYYCFALEVKTENIWNNHNYAKQLFGEILMNYKNIANIKSQYPIHCSIMLSYNNKKTDKIYSFLKSHFRNQEWNSFGKTYGIDYLFLFDAKSKKLYWNNWQDFLIALNPILY